ncbi:MAG: UbiH/UbiF/VisC/COQ6 family ubiquinone biosynthesis hydroxylase [Gammaproteobacteria bacterium]|nr:UbiH/UbiF/VisC/COQ6 family ubiquinone biosynthesis hydroxylase [Gammaproteobacteria bacterium]
MQAPTDRASLDADAIVVGAGITGLVLAGLMSRQNLRVAVVESREPGPAAEPTDIDPRALAITPASTRIISAVGAWAKLDPARIGHFRSMRVWDENGRGTICFDSRDLQRPTLGYIIESRGLQQALLEALTDDSSIAWYQPARAVQFEAGTDRAMLALDDGRRISASLVVAADGRDSAIRSLAGIGFTSFDYEQEALACVVTTEEVHADTARQRFLSRGTLAFLPLSDPHRCGIVWSTRPDEVQALLQLDDPEFHRTLAENIEYSFGEITDSGPRMSYPLGYGSADNYVQDRLALIGDAAHVVHPLAGQGANLGILDAAALYQIVTETLAGGRDPGEWLALRRYERWRKGDNRLMMQVLTGFKELFTNQQFPVPLIRNLGLDLTDRLPPIKHRIMEYAMGLRGDLPEAARIPL